MLSHKFSIAGNTPHPDGEISLRVSLCGKYSLLKYSKEERWGDFADPPFGF